MLKSVLLVSFLVGAFGAPPLPTLTHNEERIINGNRIEITRAPWQAAALYYHAGYEMYMIRCGSAIISETAVITAAQCVVRTDLDLWRIRVGSTFFSTGGQLAQVSKFKIHEDYETTVGDDIAIMWLVSPLTLDGIFARPIGIPKQGHTVADGRSLSVAGWGSTTGQVGYSSQLQSAIVTIVNQKVCADVFSFLTDKMICAGDRMTQAACDGDKGGPLVTDNLIIGIASFGGCTQRNTPGGYTRVSSYADWIEQQLG